MLFTDALLAMRRRDDQHGNLTGLKYWQIQVDITVCRNDDVQWRFRLPQVDSKLLVHGGEGWINVLRSPAVMGYRAQCASANNHSIGNRTQQAHDHLIMLIEAADFSTTRVANFVQGHDPIQCCDKVADDIGPLRMWRELETTKKSCQFGRERQITSMLHLEECFQRYESAHECTPHAEKNSARSAELLSYSPRQNVVRVIGSVSRTRRIWVQR